jgi:hypothetical protein
MEPHREEGFAIGWDYGIHGIVPAPDAPAPILEGARAAAHQFAGRTKQYDRFVKKWLQLRLGAFKRNRLFDPGVTPDFLRSIDVKYCPITRVELTHGTGRDTDWSVDRIWNDGGYATTNLAVMSSRANQIKWTMKPEDIIGRIMVDDRLEPDQWLRLLAFVNFVNPLSEGPLDSVPPVVFPPPHVPLTSPELVIQYTTVVATSGLVDVLTQEELRGAVRGKKNMKAYERYSNALFVLIRRALGKLDTRTVATGNTYTIYANGAVSERAMIWAIEDMWRDDLATHELFQRWMREFSGPSQMMEYIDRLQVYRGQRGKGRMSKSEMARQWGLANGGYNLWEEAVA